MIEIRSLDFSYQQSRPIFSGFDWNVEKGASWAVIGPSGCGKSTLLYLLAGLRRPVRGEILIEGQKLLRPRPKTGLILQDYGLLPWSTCEQNIQLGFRIRRFYGPDGKHAPESSKQVNVRELVDYWIGRLGLEDVRNHFPGQMSGGQRQRTAIARTIALDPDLLLMDEPFSSLDAPTRESLQDILLALSSEANLTTIVVTHSIEEAAVLGKKILILGRTPRTVDNPNSGNPQFRFTENYRQVCNLLRDLLNESLVEAEGSSE